MKWIEIISIRTMSNNPEKIQKKLAALLKNIIDNEDEKVIQVFRQVNVYSDYNIQLVHNSIPIEKYGSALGIYLSEILKEDGLVNHTVWERVQGFS